VTVRDAFYPRNTAVPMSNPRMYRKLTTSFYVCNVINAEQFTRTAGRRRLSVVKLERGTDARNFAKRRVAFDGYIRRGRAYVNSGTRAVKKVRRVAAGERIDNSKQGSTPSA